MFKQVQRSSECTSARRLYSVKYPRVPFILNDSVSRVLRDEFTEYSRIPGVCGPEMTEYLRVHGVIRAEMN